MATMNCIYMSSIQCFCGWVLLHWFGVVSGGPRIQHWWCPLSLSFPFRRRRMRKRWKSQEIASSSRRWMLESEWILGASRPPPSLIEASLSIRCRSFRGSRTRSCALSFCTMQCKVIVLLFSTGEGCFALSMHSEESSPCKDFDWVEDTICEWFEYRTL